MFWHKKEADYIKAIEEMNILLDRYTKAIDKMNILLDTYRNYSAMLEKQNEIYKEELKSKTILVEVKR